MDKTTLATTYTYEFEDGDTCEMTLSFIALKRLSSTNKNLYERQKKIMARKPEDELEILTLLYTAYICANQSDDVMSEDEFIEKCGSDRVAIMEAAQALTNPKKRKASANRSN